MTITRKRLRKRIRGKNAITLRKRRKSKGRKRRSFRKNRHINLRTSSLRGGNPKSNKRKKKKKSAKKRKAIQRQNKRTQKKASVTKQNKTKKISRAKKVTKPKTTTKKPVEAKKPAAKKPAAKKPAAKKPAAKKPAAKKPAAKKPAAKGTQKKKPEEKKPEVKKLEVKKPEVKKLEVKKPEVKATTTKPRVVAKTTPVPPPKKIVQKMVTQTTLPPSVPKTQVVDIKKVNQVAKKVNKNIVKQANALENTNNTAVKQILTAKDNLKKAVDKSFGSIQTAFKLSARETKNLAETIKKSTTPIASPKTTSGKKVLKIAVITDKDAQTLVSNPGGGTAVAAMRNQHQLLNTQQ